TVHADPLRARAVEERRGGEGDQSAFGAQRFQVSTTSVRCARMAAAAADGSREAMPSAIERWAAATVDNRSGSIENVATRVCRRERPRASSKITKKLLHEATAMFRWNTASLRDACTRSSVVYVSSSSQRL